MLDLYGADHSNVMVTITNGEFTSNRANWGGVLKLDLHSANPLTIGITNSEFTSNGATTGGVLYLYDADHSSITITSSKF